MAGEVTENKETYDDGESLLPRQTRLGFGVDIMWSRDSFDEEFPAHSSLLSLLPQIQLARHRVGVGLTWSPSSDIIISSHWRFDPLIGERKMDKDDRCLRDGKKILRRLLWPSDKRIPPEPELSSVSSEISLSSSEKVESSPSVAYEGEMKRLRRMLFSLAC